MKIEPLFEIGNLVQRQYEDVGQEAKLALQVMEVITQTCYAGTQIFYLCRPLFAKRHKWSESWKWTIGHGTAKMPNDAGWTKYREDELHIADDETIAIITGTV